ncbi:uracil-DNA glycosylase [Liberiplasma polymorphum]|uniref:uracil-DNA glycosylase n=1 Tax=Liberiplasma polymorphum TaxID=3374570 RepID=UPI0037754E19
MSEWKKLLSKELKAQYFTDLLKKVNQLQKQHPIYPKQEDWFKALTLTPYENVKAVILGQDPYHQKDQAMGLAFSVPKGVKIPPSLKNIFKELEYDLDIFAPSHGDLTSWANEGVLLLNTTLTVEDSKPLSHQNLGWERFTDAIINALNKKDTPVVFMLWGKHAQSKESLISNPKHLILKAPHPSPLSAHRGFLGCKHFSKTNAYLTKHNIKPINFKISP